MSSYNNTPCPCSRAIHQVHRTVDLRRGRCKTLIGSNEGSCTHDRWREGQQWYREDRCATGRRRLGLRKRTVTKCGCAGRSARRSAETDQRTEDREHGAGIGSDDISGGLLNAERHQTARWRHQSMTSRDADWTAVGMQVVLGIGRQMRTRGWGQSTGDRGLKHASEKADNSHCKQSNFYCAL